MKNECHFSEDTRYRYSLRHTWDELGLSPTRRQIMWIGLNPSTADEDKLDPTLRRIRYFSDLWGFNCFVMTNLFAFRATDPRRMLKTADPVGEENDAVLVDQAKRSLSVLACWGRHGSHLSRDRWVFELMRSNGIKLYCVGTNSDGSPRHPLYVPGATALKSYNPAEQEGIPQ